MDRAPEGTDARAREDGRSSPLEPSVALAFLVAACALQSFVVRPQLVAPLGTDYMEFLPRMLGEYFWFRLNGWFAVPWFTPAFCGGAPEWGNPQSFPYSLPQWLTFLTDPARSIQITFVLMVFAGGAGMFLLLRTGFRVSPLSAAVGAALFACNGFFSARMVAGHIPMHMFMGAPWVAWLALREPWRRSEAIIQTILAGLCVGAMIQGGMIVLLVPVGLTWAALLLLSQSRTGLMRGAWMRLAGAVLLGVMLSASKLNAMLSFTALFPRDQYALPGFRSVPALLRAAFDMLFWTGRHDSGPDFVGFVFTLETHERQYGISPIPVFIFLAAAITWLARRRPAATQRHLGPLVVFIVLMAIPLAVNLHGETWTAVLKQLPLIKSSSSLVRWFVIYIPVVAVGAGLALESLPKRKEATVLAMVGLLAWVAMSDRRTSNRNYDPSRIVSAWTAAKTAGDIPVIETMELPGYPNRPNLTLGRDDALTTGACQVFCLEPLFGYFLERLPWPPLHPGPALERRGDLLNVKNPACALFPEANHCKPGDQFTANRTEDAEAFLSWQPFPFERPLRQRLADLTTLATLVGMIVALGVAATRLRHPMSHTLMGCRIGRPAEDSGRRSR